jgi:Bacterial RNA polymerase, alpha chain C terminal domain
LQALLARIPPVAFETQLDDLGLSARVFSHLEKAGLANVGHVMQRLVEGDEAMLSVEGIGPKALAEIKTQIEAKGMGFLPEVAPAQPEAAAAAEETVPAAEAAAPEAELTLPVPEVTPPEVEVAAPVEAVVPPVEMVAPAEAPSAVAEVVPAVPQEAVATVPIAPGVIEEALGDEEFDEDEIGKGGKKKKKGLTLVFDERVGAVVAKRQRKPGRQREAWEEE